MRGAAWVGVAARMAALVLAGLALGLAFSAWLDPGRVMDWIAVPGLCG